MKKYKFEANLPFEVSKHIILKNNKFNLQVKVTNVSVNKVFPESFKFKCWKPNEFEAIDLNDEDILKNTIAFCPHEIRSFIFILEPKDSGYKINKFKTEQLG